MKMTATPSRFNLLTRMPRWMLLTAIAIISTGAVMFSPVFAAGFWTDDYTFLEMAARLPFVQYLRQYFDPRDLISWYRPLQGMLWWLEYQFFGGNSSGYHIVNVAIHIANCSLLYGLVTRITHKWWIGFVAALAFLSLPSIAIDVFWPGVADPQLSLFFLAALWFWLVYLEEGSQWAFTATFLFFVSTLLTKEMGATLIVIMFLADRLLVNAPLTLKRLFLRYLPFAAVMIPYALIEYIIQTKGVYVNFVTYGTGGKPLENLAQYLLWLTFPWSPGTTANWIAAGVVVVALLYWIVIKRERAMLFLLLGAVVSVLPVVPFPFAIERYLYLPAILSVVFLVLAFEFVRLRFSHPIWRMAAIPALVVVFFASNSAMLYDSAFNYSEFVRETRLQFRPIFQNHPTFPPDTLLYFIEPPFPTPNISGMMYLRYGDNVSVYGTDRDHIAKLRERSASFIYYRDAGAWKEQEVDNGNVARATPQPPIQFDKTISLVDFELANPKVKRGDPLVLLLYWQSAAKVDKNYTVFIHLVDAQGQTVAGVDSQPRQGQSPTSTWRPNTLVPDGMIVPVDDTVPPGDYRVELGLYDAETMQRLSIFNVTGQPVSDKIVIAPITVEDQRAR